MIIFLNHYENIEVKVQNANLNMAAKQNIKIDTIDGKLTLTVTPKITLMCGCFYMEELKTKIIA